MSLRAAALVVAACSLTASPAVADDSALKDARALTSRATVEYDVGHFDQALDLYTKAYERYPKPALLFDIGQCHRLLGHYERAIFFYQGYLRGQPEARNRALVEKFIADSQAQLDAQGAAPPSARPPAAVASGPTPSDDATAAPVPAPSTTSAPPPTSTEAAGEPTHDIKPTLRIAGLATAGVGVVLLGAAIVEGLQVNSLSNQVSQVSAQHGTWTPQAQSEYDAGKSDATVANVLTGSGLVLLAAGAVVTWYAWPRTHSTTAAVSPLPGGGAVSLISAF